MWLGGPIIYHNGNEGIEVEILDKAKKDQRYH